MTEGTVAQASNGLKTNQALARNSSASTVSSTDRRYTLQLQTDGNLVLTDQGVNPPYRLWASNTTMGSVVIIQADGNFVLYDLNRHVLWSSNTASHPGAYVTLENGSLQVDAPDGTPLWMFSSLSVTRVWPSSGPNTGGTNVEIDGVGFDTAATQITFGSTPASKITCPNATHCFVTSPRMGGFTQVLNVQATVRNVASASDPDTTFASTGGPSFCTSTFSCVGHPWGFPSVVIQCLSAVDFYEFPGASNQQLVSSGTSQSFPTNDVLSGSNSAAACFASGGSCTNFTLYEASPTYCGVMPPQGPNFCKECVAAGGKCTKLPNGRDFCAFQ